MALQLNRLVGDDLQLRVTATLLIFQAFGQHGQVFTGVITDNHNHCFLAGCVRIHVHIVGLSTQLAALIGHICWQGKTELAVQQADRLSGGVTFLGNTLGWRFGIAIITGRKPHNQQANTDIFNQIAH